jgi:anti-anti-sigma factor
MIDAGQEPQPLTVTTAAEGGMVVISLAGELDMVTAPLVLQHLSESLEQGHTRLVFDLAGLSFCDSTGLAVLVRAKNRCDAAGGFVRLAAMQPGVLQLLEIAGLQDVFQPSPTVADARGATEDGRAATD